MASGVQSAKDCHLRRPKMCDCKLPFKVFSDEFIRGLYVKSVEDRLPRKGTGRGHEEWQASDALYRNSGGQDERTVHRDHGAPLLRTQITKASKKWLLGHADALDRWRINEVRGERQPVDGEMLGGTK